MQTRGDTHRLHAYSALVLYDDVAIVHSQTGAQTTQTQIHCYKKVQQACTSRQGSDDIMLAHAGLHTWQSHWVQHARVRWSPLPRTYTRTTLPHQHTTMRKRIHHSHTHEQWAGCLPEQPIT